MRALYFMQTAIHTLTQHTSHFDSHADGKCWNNNIMGIATLCTANERIAEITRPSNEYSMKAIANEEKITHSQMTNLQATETALRFLYVKI